MLIFIYKAAVVSRATSFGLRFATGITEDDIGGWPLGSDRLSVVVGWQPFVGKSG